MHLLRQIYPTKNAYSRVLFANISARYADDLIDGEFYTKAKLNGKKFNMCVSFMLFSVKTAIFTNFRPKSSNVQLKLMYKHFSIFVLGNPRVHLNNHSGT